jgi:uncharacterized protein YjbI with pentapeptide repeats
LAGSTFDGARFQGAVTFGADFRGANLAGAAGLTPRQLMQARTDQETILPNGSRGPYLLYSGAEKTRPGAAIPAASDD